MQFANHCAESLEQRKLLRCWWAALLAALTISTTLPATAATVNIVTDPTIEATISIGTGNGTFGDEMEGMEVTADFSNGSSESLIWAGTGGNSGGVSGGLFRLNVSGNTQSANWGLLNTSGSLLTKLTINAAPGDTVFDIDVSGSGTTSSGAGVAFDETSNPLGGTIAATYSIIVAEAGQLPAGDLFAVLMVDFIGLDGGGLSASEFTFVADTDALLGQFNINPVPLPGAFYMFGSGLGLLGLVAWRRKRKVAVRAAA